VIIFGNRKFIQAQFENEDELERVVVDNADYLFGPSSIYLPKTLIKTQDGFGTVPDGFVIDLASRSWYIVEAELAKHSVWSHIAPQVAKQLIAANSPLTKRLLVNLAADHVKHNEDDLDKFREREIQDIDIRRVVSDIFDRVPLLGMPIDAVSNDLREWAATLRVSVKLWTVRKLVEFGRPENVMYELPEEFRPELDTQEDPQLETAGQTRLVVTLSDLVAAEYLKSGDILTMSYKPRNGERKTYQATIQDDGALHVLDQSFDTPSYAAIFAMEHAGTTRRTVNGWIVWKTAIGELLDGVRERYLAARAVHQAESS
jgi:hypothetical protein